MAYPLQGDGAAGLFVVLDGHGEVMAVHEVLDMRGCKYSGSLTGVAVSEDADSVYACGRVARDAADGDGEWHVMRFDLGDVRRTSGGIQPSPSAAAAALSAVSFLKTRLPRRRTYFACGSFSSVACSCSAAGSSELKALKASPAFCLRRRRQPSLHVSLPLPFAAR